MTGLRSHKQRRNQMARALRADGRSWVEVAEVLRQQYRLNARVAFRYAHGWSQRQAADEWNKRWPDELKTSKNFSYWEQWPSPTGHPPSLENFDRLAQLYECAISDLLADMSDFRHLDANTGAPTIALVRPMPDVTPASPNDSVMLPTATGLSLPDNFATLLVHYLGSWASTDRDVFATPRERDQAYHQLVQFLRSWAHTMDRRNALRLLGWAATTASVFPALNLDEQERIAAVLSRSSRVDAQTIEHIEAVLERCTRQDDTLGPQAALHTVIAQRDLGSALLPGCPDALRPRMLSVLSNASRQAGWLSFDLNQFDHAAYYYEDARTLAHEAENTELGAFVLCQMSHLATWQSQPRIGIDHAVTAGQWAHRTGDLRLRAYTANVAARAYAADGQREACMTALDTAHTTLAAAGDHHSPEYLQFYDEAQQVGTRGECHLTLHEGQAAAEYYHQSLGLRDQSYVRNIAFTTLHRGMAYTQCKEIDEAARLIGEAGEIAARNSSARLTERLKQARAELQPWKDTTAVRQLDQRLASYSVT